MLFKDRKQAGELLASRLEHYRDNLSERLKTLEPLAVALPRGGVPLALEVARKFRCPMEIIAAKKLPFPHEPEYAIGAVSSDGVVVLNQEIPNDPSWTSYIENQKIELLASTKNKEDLFFALSGAHRTSFEGKLVFIIDDGVATGMTALAAVESAKRRGAKYVVMAAPVMSVESARQLRTCADDIVALSVPPTFNAVGAHYVNFEQTQDAEVIAAMRETLKFTPSGTPMQNGISHAQKS